MLREGTVVTRAERDELQQVWRKRVDAFHASGQSGTKWCTAHEIKEHQLWYWVRRFRSAPMTPSLNTSTKFMPLQVKEPISTENSSLLVHVGAFTIEISPGYNEQLLRSLVQTLKSLC